MILRAYAPPPEQGREGDGKGGAMPRHARPEGIKIDGELSGLHRAPPASIPHDGELRWVQLAAKTQEDTAQLKNGDRVFEWDSLGKLKLQKRDDVTFVDPTGPPQIPTPTPAPPSPPGPMKNTRRRKARAKKQKQQVHYRLPFLQSLFFMCSCICLG